MCFYTKGSILRIATKDIECYKFVIIDKNHCISFYQEFKYEYDKIYSNKSKWTLFLRWLFNDNVISEAYHSSTGPYYAYSVRCIIPKGSLYLLNRNKEEYCSTSIIIKN